MNDPIDIMRRDRRPASKPREFYQRPHCYSVAVPFFNISLKPTCLSPNRQRTPAITLFVQADLSNINNVNVGDATTNLTNGIELDPGKSVLFSVSNQAHSMQPMGFNEAMEYQRDLAIGPEFAIQDPDEVFLDVADFFAAAGGVGCRLRVFWTKTTRY